MKNIFFMAIAISTAFLFSCKDTPTEESKADVAEVVVDDFNYLVEQFADIKVLRYQIPSWDDLTLKEQKLVYYLTQAGLEGRDDAATGLHAGRHRRCSRYAGATPRSRSLRGLG